MVAGLLLRFPTGSPFRLPLVQVTVLSLSTDAGEGRSGSVKLNCGDETQIVNIIQGVVTISPATCAEVLAGPDSKTYQVTGTVTSIVNTTYGNWYLNDGTGEVYIYGTLDSKGSTKNFSSCTSR